MKIKLTLLFVAALVTQLAGCGGGTVGTDGGAPLRVSGTVADSSGRALDHALVILEATGDSARANQQGHFEITTSKVEKSRFRVDTQVNGEDLSVVSEEVIFDQRRDEETFSITVSVEEGAATVEDVQVDPLEPKPTPAGTNSPSPASPTPEATRSTLKGTIHDQFGNLVKGVEVTIEGDRTSARSNRNGIFELSFTPRESRLGILLQYQKQRARISLTGLPAKPSHVSMKIKLQLPGKTYGRPQIQGEDLVNDFSYRVKLEK